MTFVFFNALFGRIDSLSAAIFSRRIEREISLRYCVENYFSCRFRRAYRAFYTVFETGRRICVITPHDHGPNECVIMTLPKEAHALSWVCVSFGFLCNCVWGQSFAFYQLLLYPFQITMIYMVNVGFRAFFGVCLTGN